MAGINLRRHRNLPKSWAAALAHRGLLVALFFFALTSGGSKGYCQEKNGVRYPASVGISASEYGDDSSLGVEFTTPSFLYNRMSARVRGNLLWLEQYKAAHDVWARYHTVTTSLAYHLLIVERSRIYFELGTYFVLPDPKFSREQYVTGLTGAAGVELFLGNQPGFGACYYFSAGFGSARAHADRLEGSPRYGNGLILSTGFRFYL